MDTPPLQQQDTSQIIDHFFRYEYGKISSHLIKVFGSAKIEMVEDAVQDALLKATQHWPFTGIPHHPEAWILRVAKNAAIDMLRKKDSSHQSIEGIHVKLLEEDPNEIKLEHELKDDVLKMMFACCHPSISEEHQIILTLKILSGFSTKEVARALLKSEEAVTKAYTRAKNKFKSHVTLLVPEGADLDQRLNIILKIIYVIFNEGYNSIDETHLIRKDLCEEAIRLAHHLLEPPIQNKSDIYALLALMYFHASRFDARISKKGELLTLKEQDRSIWNKEMIHAGRYYLLKASELPDHISEYHVQAAISATHCFATSFDDTNWKEILDCYDMLVQLKPDAITSLNRLVAYAEIYGPEKALEELLGLESRGNLTRIKAYYAIRAYLSEQSGNVSEAVYHYSKALDKTRNITEQQFLLNKIHHLKQGA